MCLTLLCEKISICDPSWFVGFGIFVKVVRPILVANARVDWMSLDDSDITQQFEILREGILRDVFSQRASSTWQGMQPQRLIVSLLLPGMNSKADEWLDFLQGQRQFWPTMTTRHSDAHVPT